MMYIWCMIFDSVTTWTPQLKYEQDFVFVFVCQSMSWIMINHAYRLMLSCTIKFQDKFDLLSFMILNGIKLWLFDPAIIELILFIQRNLSFCAPLFLLTRRSGLTPGTSEVRTWEGSFELHRFWQNLRVALLSCLWNKQYCKHCFQYCFHLPVEVSRLQSCYMLAQVGPGSPAHCLSGS